MNDEIKILQHEIAMAGPIYTPKEAAEKLDCTERTIWNRIRRGELVGHLVNGLRVIPQSSLDQYLEFKKLKIKKTEFIPDGCSIIPTVELSALVQNTQRLAVLNQRLLEYEGQEEEARVKVLEAEQRVQEAEQEKGRLELERIGREQEIEELRADLKRKQEENQALKGRGFFARLLRRGEGSTSA